MKEKIFKILHNRDRMPGERFGDIEGKIEEFFNQEVEKRIAERMPTMEETIDIANEYVSHKSLHKANKGLIRDAVIIGVNMFRSRLTNPGVNDIQKTEGGEG